MLCAEVNSVYSSAKITQIKRQFQEIHIRRDNHIFLLNVKLTTSLITNHALDDIIAFEAPHQGSHLVSSMPLLQGLVEHLNTCYRALEFLSKSKELTLHPLLYNPSFQPTTNYSATT